MDHRMPLQLENQPDGGADGFLVVDQENALNQRLMVRSGAVDDLPAVRTICSARL